MKTSLFVGNFGGGDTCQSPSALWKEFSSRKSWPRARPRPPSGALVLSLKRPALFPALLSGDNDTGLTGLWAASRSGESSGNAGCSERLCPPWLLTTPSESGDEHRAGPAHSFPTCHSLRGGIWALEPLALCPPPMRVTAVCGEVPRLRLAPGTGWVGSLEPRSPDT